MTITSEKMKPTKPAIKTYNITFPLYAVGVDSDATEITVAKYKPFPIPVITLIIANPQNYTISDKANSNMIIIIIESLKLRIRPFFYSIISDKINPIVIPSKEAPDKTPT